MTVNINENTRIELTAGRLLALFAGVLTLAGAGYATRETMLAEVDERTQQTAVTREQYWELREEMRTRLSRIEATLSRLERDAKLLSPPLSSKAE